MLKIWVTDDALWSIPTLSEFTKYFDEAKVFNADFKELEDALTFTPLEVDLIIVKGQKLKTHLYSRIVSDLERLAIHRDAIVLISECDYKLLMRILCNDCKENWQITFSTDINDVLKTYVRDKEFTVVAGVDAEEVEWDV